MKPDAGQTTRASSRRFASWLAVAVLLHALLLLIPAGNRLDPARILHTLSISLNTRLQDPVAPLIPQAPADEPAMPPLPAADAKSRPAPAQPPTELSPPPPPDLAAPPVTLPANPAPSATLLFDSANRLRLQKADPHAPRRLGEHVPEPPPANWQPGVSAGPNRFDGLTAPEKLEVVDRWLAADGSHNVVVNTPSGDTFCGRAAAWDPMQPLIEPVMSWRPCAGGGKRSFEIPSHNAERMRELRQRP